MAQNVAVFLDLDNLVIGARQANLTFNIHHILEYLQSLTNGRIVLRRAYGDSHQNRELMRDLTAAGFITQANLSINNFGKNLADMQITVDAMESLVDERPYHTYVLITGDQDFSPLTQALRKRDKYVIGIGVRHATSATFASLCDQYLYYEDIVPTATINEAEVKKLLSKSLEALEKEMKKVRASVLKQRMDELSRGAFSNSSFAEGGFRKFLQRYPGLVRVEQEETTTYVATPIVKKATRSNSHAQYHLQYRTLLKKQKLRVIPVPARLLLLKEMIARLQQQEHQWRALINLLVDALQSKGHEKISKNLTNATLLLAREAGVICVHKVDSLAYSPVSLALAGENLFQRAVVLCDRTYLASILELPEPFDIQEVSLALYDSPGYVPYLQRIMPSMPRAGEQVKQKG